MQATLIRLFRRSSRSPEQYFSPAHYEGYFTRQNMLRKISVESSLGHQILHRHRINAVARLSFTSKTNYAAAQLAKQVESKVVRIGKAVKETEQAVAGPWTAKRMRLPAVSSASVDQRLAQEDRTLWEELEAEGLLLESHQPARVALPPSMHRLPRTNIPGRSLSTSTTSTWSIARERLRTLPPVRPYSVIAANRAAALAAQIPPETIVDLKQIMNDLRDLELLDKLQGVKPKSATSFKDATRTLYPLWHKLDQGGPPVTFAQLQAQLPPIFSVPWTHISQRLADNTVYRLDAIDKDDRIALELMQVFNVGSARADSYIQAGSKGIKDLERLHDAGLIKLQRAHIIGLRHFDDINRLIPRDEMENIKEALETTLKAANKSFECEILGSFRRGLDFSSDIDLVVRHKSFVSKDDEETGTKLMKQIVAALEKSKLISDDDRLMKGWKKYAGLVRLPKHKHYRRIDIRLAPYHSYPYMLLGATGDALLMKLLRHTAKEKGMCLNEYGMGDKFNAKDDNPNGFRPGTLRAVKNEKEIFELLGFPALKPEEREYKTWSRMYEKAGVDLS